MVANCAKACGFSCSGGVTVDNNQPSDIDNEPSPPAQAKHGGKDTPAATAAGGAAAQQKRHVAAAAVDMQVPVSAYEAGEQK